MFMTNIEKKKINEKSYQLAISSTFEPLVLPVILVDAIFRNVLMKSK